jgi:hypothetical protein
MFARTLAALTLLAGAVSAYVNLLSDSMTLSHEKYRTTVTVLNNCTSQVDPAFFPTVTRNGASTGGFSLAPKASAAVTLPDKYSGRIWGRTGCNSAGTCSTGGCPGGESCTGPSTQGPTLAQFTINGFSSTDFFNPSTADGFNLGVTITPGAGCK